MTEKQLHSLKIIEKVVFVSLICISILGGIVFGLIVSEIAVGEEMAMLENYRPSIPTRLYDRNGEVFAELFRHKQELVRFQDIPPHVVEAFLSVEDDNFFNHFGIDIPGIFRAAIKNLIAREIVQGGSTLTQQVAKQIYLHTEGKRGRTFTQKIRETVLALQIEEELSKEEILEVFFNVIYLGHGCQGLACASRLYFDKKVQDLTLAEGALLARLPKSPVEYSPFKDPTEAMRQHKIVLRHMAEDGILPANQVDSIHSAFWKDYWKKVVIQSPSQNVWADRLDLAPFFTDYVRQILEASTEIGPEKLYTRGLRVYTTLDLHHQQIAEQEMLKTMKNANTIGRNFAETGGKGGVDGGLFGVFGTLSMLFPVGSPIVRGLDERGLLRKEIEEFGLEDAAQLLTFLVPGASNQAAAFEEFRKATVSYTTNLEVQGAYIAIEPRTGYIIAMIGGKEFSPQNQYNRALLARRQPGSAFKVFVYGAALENRAINSMTALNDAPFYSISPDGSTFSPGNYDEGFRGVVPATTALALSLNTCSVQVYYRIGADPIIDFATRLMKIPSRSRFNPDPALALGASEVTPFEMATGVSIIANDGRDVFPFAVRYVTDQSGNFLYNKEAEIRKIIAQKTSQNQIQIIEPGLAFILRQMMKAVSDSGTATLGLRSGEYGNFSGDMASKTGTTSSWSDAWIVGFNPEIATAIWFGFDKSSVTLGPGQAGGHIASPVLGTVFRRYYQENHQSYPSFKDRPDGDKPPAGVDPAPCNGYQLAPRTIGDRTQTPPKDGTCGGDRMYDQRELLMKEFGITPEDLGKQGQIRFKKEGE